MVNDIDFFFFFKKKAYLHFCQKHFFQNALLKHFTDCSCSVFISCIAWDNDNSDNNWRKTKNEWWTLMTDNPLQTFIMIIVMIVKKSKSVTKKKETRIDVFIIHFDWN